MNIEALEEKQEAHRIKVAKLYVKAKMIRLEKYELGMETCRLALWRHGKRVYVTDQRQNGYLQILGEYTSEEKARRHFVSSWIHSLTD